jgi:Na+-transporting NADH:ubiquinone oxidoreductase subunit NqrF
MAKLLIPEVLELVSKAKTKKEKVEILQKHNHPALKDIIRVACDDDVVSLLPEGTPPYQKDDAPIGYSVSSLYKVHKQFKYFFKGPIGNQVKPVRRESLFINALESIHPIEAELLCLAKDKKSDLDPKFYNEVFPGLIVKVHKPKAVKKATKTKKEKKPMK